MYAETYVDILHFNEDTKQSSATCQNPEKPQSQLSAALTRVQLNMCWTGPRPVLWLLLHAFFTAK